jgi:hypothetical protein
MSMVSSCLGEQIGMPVLYIPYCTYVTRFQWREDEFYYYILYVFTPTASLQFSKLLMFYFAVLMFNLNGDENDDIPSLVSKPPLAMVLRWEQADSPASRGRWLDF